MIQDLADRPDLPPELRLVPYAYRAEFGHPAAGVWHSPGVVTLLRDGDTTLSFAARWGAIVAAEPRDDGILELAWMNRPAERLRLPVTDVVPGSARDGAALGPVWALREAGHSIGGATLLVSVDLPIGSGLAAATATACAVALSLRDLYAPSVPVTELARLVARGLHRFAVTEANEVGRCATALLASAGRATLWRPLPNDSVDPDEPPTGEITHPWFDPAAAGLRLMIVDTRVRCTPTPPAPERANVEEAISSFSGRNPDGLGPLLTLAHMALHHADVPDDAQDLAVTAALNAGALGARMLWDGPGRPVCALMPAERLTDVRSAITQAFAQNNRRSPRFLTVTPATGARRAG